MEVHTQYSRQKEKCCQMCCLSRHNLAEIEEH